jgi:endonuclease/exonuclease/phosphatase family metal-dependent hydrolase
VSTFRIVTLNTWKCDGDYARRLALMAEGLRELSADVICLQECFIGGGANTAASLAQALGMQARPAPARRKLRDLGAQRVMSTSGLAILTRVMATAFDVCALITDPRDGQRIAQRLDLDHDGKSLRILNLHLTHLPGVSGEAIRRDQLAMALGWATNGYEGGLVVAGDLNATANNVALAPLALSPAPATFQGPRDGGPASEGLAIDHCTLFRGGPWRVAGTHRALNRPDADGWFASDHAAVVLDLIAEG